MALLLPPWWWWKKKKKNSLLPEVDGKARKKKKKRRRAVPFDLDYLLLPLCWWCLHVLSPVAGGRGGGAWEMKCDGWRQEKREGQHEALR